MSIYELEKRILFEGAVAIQTAEAVIAEMQQPDNQAIDSTNSEPQTTENSQQSSETDQTQVFIDGIVGAQYPGVQDEVAFIDSGIKDFNVLADAYNTEGISTVILDSQESGVQQISKYLAAQSNIFDTIHIVSEGNYRQIMIGDDVITVDNIQQYETSFSSWQTHIASDGDILIYGCDIAKDNVGQSMLGKVAEWTGADISASTDTTGLQGDWDLEYSTEAFQAHSITVQDYRYNLETYTVTAVTDDGTGTENTLSWAINSSNASADVDDIIAFNLDSGSTVTISTTMPIITDTVTIDGTNHGLTGGNVTVQVTNPYNWNGTIGDPNASAFNVFNVSIGSGNTAIIENITIRGGYELWDGGAITIGSGHLNISTSIIKDSGTKYDGGGIIVKADATLTLQNSTVSNNFAYYYGGGIANYGSLYLSGANINDNTANWLGGGISNGGIVNGDAINESFIKNNIAKIYGGGVYNEATDGILSTNITITGNQAFDGGGIYNDRSFVLSIDGINVSNNYAPGNGGGIYNLGTINSISSSLVSNNQAGFNGGGVFNGVNSSLDLSGFTISNNAAGYYGGGIYDDGTYTSGALVISNHARIGDNYTTGFIISISGELPDGSPNDPNYPELWNMLQSNAPDVWKTWTGDQNFVLAISDDGFPLTNNLPNPPIINNPDLIGNYVFGSYPYLEYPPSKVWDGHGTHTSGTAGAVGNNGIGVAGVNWNISLFPLPLTSYDTIYYAIDTLKAKVINCSWGWGLYQDEMYDPFKYAEENGVLMITAAGNYALNNDEVPFYPASFGLDNIISVAATGSYDGANNLAAFSNYGIKSVDIGAPGVGILSTVPYNVYGSDYGYMRGTSMAAPLVAGAASLIWSKNPDLTYLEVKDSILNGVKTSGTNLTNLVKTGGVLDVYRSFLIASYEYQTKTNISLDASSPWDWNTPVNWEFSTDNGATWTAATEAPNAYNCHRITIKPGHNVSINDDLTLCKTTIEEGASLTVADGINLGIIEWGDGNDLTINGTMFNEGSITLDADLAGYGRIISSNGSSFEYAKSADQSIFGSNYYNLTLGGSGEKLLAGVIDIDGDLTIGAGTDLDVSSLDYQINIAGNFLNRGTFDSGEGTVVFDGNAPGKTITSGESNGKFCNLSFTGSGGGWTLQDDMHVSGSFTVTDGEFISGNNTVLLYGTNASYSDINAAKTSWESGTLDIQSDLNQEMPLGEIYSNLNLGRYTDASGVTVYDILNSNSSVGGEFTVDDNARMLLSCSVDAENRTYNGTNAVDVILNDNHNPIASKYSSFSYSYSAQFATKTAGLNKVVYVTDVSISGADAVKYQLASDSATAHADIFQASLTLRADNEAKGYGRVFVFNGAEFTSSALFAGDTVASALIASAGAQKYATTGSYAITISAASGTGLENYSISYITGIFTVTGDFNGRNAAINDATDISAVLFSSVNPTNSSDSPDGNFGDGPNRPIFSFNYLHNRSLNYEDEDSENSLYGETKVPDVINEPDDADDDEYASSSEPPEEDYLAMILNSKQTVCDDCSLRLEKHHLFKSITDLHLEALLKTS